MKLIDEKKYCEEKYKFLLSKKEYYQKVLNDFESSQKLLNRASKVCKYASYFAGGVAIFNSVIIVRDIVEGDFNGVKLLWPAILFTLSYVNYSLSKSNLESYNEQQSIYNDYSEELNKYSEELKKCEEELKNIERKEKELELER